MLGSCRKCCRRLLSVDKEILYVHDVGLSQKDLFKNYTSVVQGGTPDWVLEQKKRHGPKS